LAVLRHLEILSLRLVRQITSMYKICFFLFLFSSLGFSQNLEESIYVTAETFINNQNETSLQHLTTQEASFKKQVKTKDEQLALVFLQSHKGYYLDQHSKLNEAISTYEDVLKRFNTNELSTFSDFDIIENCMLPLGNLFTKTGDYTNAESTIKQYTFLAEKRKNTSQQISGAINLAKLYQTIGKHETVLKIVEDAFKLPNISSEQKELLQGIKTSSLISLNKYYEASLLNDGTLYSKFNKHKIEYLIELKKDNFKSALNSFKKAKEYINQANLSSRELAKFYVEESQLYYLLNNPSSALKSLQQAIKILIPNFNTNAFPNKTDLYAENTFIDIFDLYAETETNPKTALQSFDLSFYVSDLLQNNWTSQEAKILNETNNRIRSEKCINILIDSYRQTKDKTLLFDALQYSENNKASTLKEIFQKKIRLEKFPDDSLLIKEFKLLKIQERITSSLINEQLGGNQASKINDLSKQLSDTSFKLKRLNQQISNKYPDVDSFFSINALNKKLQEDNAVLVEYFYGEQTIYQFIVSNKNIQLNQIELNVETKNKIIKFIHLFDDATIINNDINNFTSQAFNMFEMLKLNAISEYKNAIIIPDGLLNFIPFETLLSTKTKSASFAKMPFVINSQNIAYNSSAYFYITKSEPSKSNKLLGIFPVFENTNKQLTYSINEAKAIEEEMVSSMLINSNATKTNFIKNASEYGILHLSTHASSGDLIKPANIDFYEDTLYLNELYSLDLNPTLVVLSACETGIGKLYKGEGAMSIARGFQYSGAENLLFSLWQINDLSTSQIMASFYKNYSKQQSAYLANHQSKLDYLQNEAIGNIKKSPYYWGAFVYYGELAKPNKNYQLLYIFIGVAILLIIVFLLLKFKNSHEKNIARIPS
jgi:CHAT domain-containing protein